MAGPGDRPRLLFRRPDRSSRCSTEPRVFPALPVAPLLLVGALRDRSASTAPSPSSQALGGEDGLAWPVIRLLMAAALRLVGLADHRPLDRRHAARALGSASSLLDTVGAGDRRAPHPAAARPRRALGPGRRRGRPPSGSRPTSRCGLRRASSAPSTPDEDDSDTGRPRRRARDRRPLPRRPRRDRQPHADDEGLLDAGPRLQVDRRAGQPAAAARSTCSRRRSVTPSQVGGVPLIEVEALAARRRVPYAGPDRRASRKTKVSVVVPAMNEAQNIGHVLAPAARGPARGDPRRRQLRGRTRSRPPARPIPRSASSPRAAAARATPSAPASPPSPATSS